MMPHQTPPVHLTLQFTITCEQQDPEIPQLHPPYLAENHGLSCWHSSKLLHIQLHIGRACWRSRTEEACRTCNQQKAEMQFRSSQSGHSPFHSCDLRSCPWISKATGICIQETLLLSSENSQHSSTQLGAYECTHTGPMPLILGNFEKASRTCSGSIPARELTFHLPHVTTKGSQISCPISAWPVSDICPCAGFKSAFSPAYIRLSILQVMFSGVMCSGLKYVIWLFVCDLFFSQAEETEICPLTLTKSTNNEPLILFLIDIHTLRCVCICTSIKTCVLHCCDS